MIGLSLALQAAFLCGSPYLHDGDNIRCAGGPTMRLARIQAPELLGSPRCGRGCDGQAGLRSRDHLRRLVAGRRVTCEVVDASPSIPGFQSADQYGRPVVRCSADGVGDLSEAQVRAGHARRWPSSQR